MTEPTRLDARQRGITRQQVDPDALDVVHRLSQAGFQALLVGGCVRDLLLGARPKDFDVATSATPEEVRRLFRRSRLVGRRFRIAHVRYGRHVIEVSTFRRSHGDDESEGHHSDEGMIIRDNVYGTLEEDAFRRDFTVNALYYDPETEEILDYVGGIADLDRKHLRFIGQAEVRLREDPVRVLRAVRFQSKLNFHLDQSITAKLDATALRLSAIPAARLFDELVKLLVSGYAARAWAIIEPTALRTALFPSTDADDELIRLAMTNTDSRMANDLPVTAAFLLAVLMWADYRRRSEALLTTKKPAEARPIAASETLNAQQQITAIPRRMSHFVRDVWALQPRLEARYPRSVESVARHPRFRAAYDFLLLRAQTGEVSAGDEPASVVAAWWTEYQEADNQGRNAMVDERRSQQPKRRRRRRRNRSPKTAK